MPNNFSSTFHMDPVNYFINGEAGVGKSRYISDNFSSTDSRKYYLLLAPTGVAACNIGGKTINSFFCLGKNANAAEPEKICEMFPSHKRSQLKRALAVVIDECYVVSLSVMQKVDEIMRTLLGSNEPFGGKAMIFLGDVRQLPSVEKPAFFGSNLYKSLNAVRQDLPYDISKKPRLTPEYREVCNYLRLGRTSNELLTFITNFDGAKVPFGQFAVYYRNADVRDHNDKIVKQLPGEMKTVTVEKINSDGKLKYKTYNFKVDMRIMLRRNYDLDNGLCNGTIGNLVDFDGRILTIKIGETQHCIENGTKFEPAYAMTIHRCQGLTLDTIDVYTRKSNLSSQDATRLMYVAITRVKSAQFAYLHLLDD